VTRWIGGLFQGREPDDSLDEPLHLQILTSLASNLANHPTSTQQDQNDLETIVKGLPSSGNNSIFDGAEEWVGDGTD